MIFVSFPHALEDFHYRELSKIAIAPRFGPFILAAAYTLQIIGIVLVLRLKPLGAWLLAAMSAIWCVGAVILHGHDMLLAGPNYRHGFLSRALEGGIIVLGATGAVLGAATARIMARVYAG